MSTVFTHDAREQALLQGPKALEFVKTLHRLYCLLCRVLIQSNHVVAPEVFIENRYTYKQQEDYLCFDGDFDNDNDDNDTDVSKIILLPSIMLTTLPTTASSNLLLTLINQVSATPPPTPQLTLSPFNFSYIDVTPSRTTPCPSADSDTVPFKPVLCDEPGSTIIPTTSLERIISYSLLSSQLLILSQFIKLSYGDNHFCTVLTSKQRPATLPSSIPNTITKSFTPSLRGTPSRSVSPDDVSNHPYSFPSSVDVGLMMILIMMILPTILITILTILPMMLLLLPAVFITHKEQDVFPNMNTVILTTVSMTIPSDPTPSATFLHDSGKRKELRLHQQQFWAFIQKLHYSRIGSSCSGFQWITAILYKLSMTIWNL